MHNTRSDNHGLSGDRSTRTGTPGATTSRFTARAGLAALLAVLATLATLVLAGATPASASTLNGIATIANPTSLKAVTSGASTGTFTVALPNQAACDGDTASHGYHIYSYLVPKGTVLSGVTFESSPSVGFGLVDNTGTYYGPVNTAIGTGQIVSIPNNFEWGPLVSSDGVTLSQLLYTGSGTTASGIWEAGLVCADTHGAVADNWNTEVTFNARSSDPNGFTWTAVPGPTGSSAAAFTSAASTTFTEGSASTFTPTASGSPVPTITESGSLPAGVTFTGSALTGTPTVTGTFPITLTATNGILTPAAQSFTLTVGQAPTFTSANSTTFTVGAAGTFTVTASGYPAPSFGETGSLPSGVTLSSAGVLSGTPAAGTSGSYPITITAANGTSPNATQSFTLTIPVVVFHITTTSLPDATVGTAYSQQLSTAGGGSPIVWKKVSLPKGFALSSTGLLTGTPTSKAVGPFSVGVSVSSDRGTPVTASIPLTVDEAPVFGKKSPIAASFDEGVAGTATVSAVGYPAPTFSETGSLPSGVTLNATTGVLSGTPATTVNSATYAITITAANGIAPSASQAFTLTVYAPLIITTTTLPGATRGTAYDGTGFQLQATGGIAPYAWKKSAALPKGLALSSTGVLSGTLSTTLAAGSSSVSVSVTVKEGKTAVTVSTTLTLQIS